MAKTPESTLERKPEEELRKIAQGIAQNEIFTDRHIDPGDTRIIPMIFMPLAFMDRKQILDLQRKMRPGMIYAYMTDAGPRAINDHPMFFECHLLHPEDATFVWDIYRKISSNLSGHDT